MPVYEYQCAKCEHEFEREQRMSDAPVKTCPKCKARRVKKLISQTSFVLKGGGWYADGYGSKSESKDKTSGDSSSDDSSSVSSSSDDKPVASDAKSDGKPAKSADSKPGTSSDSDSKKKKSKKPSGKAAA